MFFMGFFHTGCGIVKSYILFWEMAWISYVLIGRSPTAHSGGSSCPSFFFFIRCLHEAFPPLHMSRFANDDPLPTHTQSFMQDTVLHPTKNSVSSVSAMLHPKSWDLVAHAKGCVCLLSSDPSPSSFFFSFSLLGWRGRLTTMLGCLGWVWPAR